MLTRVRANAGWTLVLGTLLLAGCGGGGGDPTRSSPELNTPATVSAEDRTLRPGETLSLTVTASDPEGDPFVLSAEGMPAGASFDPASGLFTWTPEGRAAGVHYLAFVATDANDPGIQGFRTVAVTVLPTPLPDPLQDPEKEEGGKLQGGTVFGQSLPARDAHGDIFPGQANFWDLDNDLSLLSGGDESLFEGALRLDVVTDAATNTAASFPAVPYSDLTWSEPFFTQADGVKTVAVTGADAGISGRYSAMLNGTSDSRLQQDVDLAGAGTPLTLSWSDLDLPAPGNFEGEPTRYDLVIRDRDGAVLRRESIADLPDDPMPMTRDLSPFAGARITVSFEARFADYGVVLIDDVSLRDASGREYVFNGDFEKSDLRGWKTALALESQNVASVPRDLAGIPGLRVTRSFFTAPTSPWGRWVDVFENTSLTDSITVPVRYVVSLGSYLNDDPAQGTARIYLTPNATGALSIWDARELMKRTGNLPGDVAGGRDIGLVFGNLDDDFITLNDLSAPNGAADIFLLGQIDLAPGEQKAIVNFIVMDTVDTGETAANLSALAAGVDAVNQGIVRDFWAPGSPYRTGIPDDLPILNFPR